MKNRITLLISYCLIALLPVLHSCKKDDSDPEGRQPTINAGEDLIGITAIISPMTLAAEDFDGDALEFSWTLVKSPGGSSPSVTFTSNINANFVTDVAGLYEVEITVKDPAGNKASDRVIFYIGGALPKLINANTVLPDLFQDDAIPDYYAPVSIQVTAGLTLEPGVVLECGTDVRIMIDGNAAFFNAEGKSSENIIIRGMSQSKGSWRGIHIASANVNNRINYAKLMHAGSSAMNNQKTTVLLQSNVSGRMSIKNTSISQSAGYALYCDGNLGEISEFASNNFSDNDAAPMRIGAENTYVLDINSIFTNNGKQAIEVGSSGNTSVRFSNDGSIKATSIPYYFYSSAELNAKVTFEAGVTCLFNSGLRIWVTTSGSIIANGTEQNPVTFSGIDKVPGGWLGIEIASASVLNNLNYTEVSYGGSKAGRGANIYMYGSSPGSQLTLTNSTVSNSQTYGVWSSSSAAILTESDNTFNNNPSGDIRRD